MLTGFRIGRLAGIDLYIDWSLVIVFTLLFFGLGGGVFPAWHPDWSAGLSFSLAFAAALLFFVSVLLHELAHALVGRRGGVQVSRITLFVFGGVAHVEREPATWKTELLMAIAGPVTSFALSIAFVFLATLLNANIDSDDPGQILAAMTPLSTMLFWLGEINLALAVFHLVPGFPLDGGRAFRAIMWAITGELRRA